MIEDKIRICEKNKDFGQTFINLARSVYVNNDKRAKIKSRINAGLILIKLLTNEPSRISSKEPKKCIYVKKLQWQLFYEDIVD